MDLAQGALGGLVQQGDRIGSEQVLVASHAAQALTKILRRVGRRCGRQRQAVVDAGEQGPVPAKKEAVPQLRKADQHQGQQGAAVPVEVGWAAGAARGSRLAGFRPPPAEPGVHLSLCTGLSVGLLSKVGVAHPP